MLRVESFKQLQGNIVEGVEVLLSVCWSRVASHVIEVERRDICRELCVLFWRYSAKRFYRHGFVGEHQLTSAYAKIALWSPLTIELTI